MKSITSESFVESSFNALLTNSKFAFANFIGDACDMINREPPNGNANLSLIPFALQKQIQHTKNTILVQMQSLLISKISVKENSHEKQKVHMLLRSRNIVPFHSIQPNLRLVVIFYSIDLVTFVTCFKRQ